MARMRPSRLGLLLVLVVCLGGCSDATPEDAPPTGATTSSQPAPQPVTPQPLATPAPSSSPAPGPSALDDLADFLAEARAVDARLRAAAELVNGTIRTDSIVVDERTAAAVKAASEEAVPATIPAGMPDELLEAVLVVYSGLVSRHLAMSQFGWARTYERGGPDAPQGAFEGDGMIECLPNGSAAARGFAADLADVIEEASSVPPLAAVDPASLAPAEVAVQVYVIQLRNGGCGACGGYQMSALASITWDDGDGSATTRTGTIVARDDPDDPGAEHALHFSVSYTPGAGWTVSINAC